MVARYRPREFWLFLLSDIVMFSAVFVAYAVLVVILVIAGSIQLDSDHDEPQQQHDAASRPDDSAHAALSGLACSVSASSLEIDDRARGWAK
jgi:heme/copper-type cytochrome/quinol oxidase subunit 3